MPEVECNTCNGHGLDKDNNPCSDCGGSGKVQCFARSDIVNSYQKNNRNKNIKLAYHASPPHN